MPMNTNEMSRILTMIMQNITLLARIVGSDERTILKYLTDLNEIRLAKKNTDTTVN